MYKAAPLGFSIGDRVVKGSLRGTIVGYGHWPIGPQFSHRPGQPYYIVVEDDGNEAEEEWFESQICSEEEHARRSSAA